MVCGGVWLAVCVSVCVCVCVCYAAGEWGHCCRVGKTQTQPHSQSQSSATCFPLPLSFSQPCFSLPVSLSLPTLIFSPFLLVSLSPFLSLNPAFLSLSLSQPCFSHSRTHFSPLTHTHTPMRLRLLFHPQSEGLLTLLLYRSFTTNSTQNPS